MKIAIFGATNYAINIYDMLLEMYGEDRVEFFIDSMLRKDILLGKPVYSPAQLRERNDLNEYIYYFGSVASRESMKAELRKLGVSESNFAAMPDYSEESFKKSMPWIVVGSVAISIGFFAYVLTISGDMGLDTHNYQSGLKNACTLLGCTCGLVLVHIIDSKFINFETEARWYAQVIKLVGGLVGVLIIKSGLSAPLTALFGNEFVARAVRYFLIVGFAGAVWPLTFKWFKTLRIGFMEKFTDWVKSLFTKAIKTK